MSRPDPRSATARSGATAINPRPARRPRRPQRSGWATAAAAATLVVSLAGWGWFASEGARVGWWPLGEHVAITPDSDGWAGVDTLQVRLTGTEAVTDIDGDTPPEGYAYLAVDLEVEAGQSETLRTCEVVVQDDQGRRFLAGEEVPSGDLYASELQCGTTDPVEEPVDQRQSLLVLLPADTTPTAVVIGSQAFPPAEFIELPLGS